MRLPWCAAFLALVALAACTTDHGTPGDEARTPDESRAIWSDGDTGFAIESAGGPAIEDDAGCAENTPATTTYTAPNTLSSAACGADWTIHLSDDQSQQLREQLAALRTTTETMPCLHPPLEELTVVDHTGQARRYLADYDSECEGLDQADGYIAAERLGRLYDLISAFATDAGVVH
ncbi:MAG: hypothetical protein QM778_38555 [Myxococcales bacterium]